ncbi:transposase [Nocardia brevicatena]|uniref:transposase n=1 Tax=Nocardia brevicatena TaxID=37327 RepID=UPI001C3F426A|nr:transposase [Nocardia brevicatena]
MPVIAEQAGDGPQLTAILDRVEVPKPGGGRAQTGPGVGRQGLSQSHNRVWLRRRRIKATIPVPADQAVHRRARGRAGGRPPAFGSMLSRDRNTVERGTNQLELHLAVATRFDKLAVRYLETIHVAAINQWLRHE